MQLIAGRVNLGAGATTPEELRGAVLACAHVTDRLQHVSVLATADRSSLVVAFWVESGGPDPTQRCSALLDRALAAGGFTA